MRQRRRRARIDEKHPAPCPCRGTRHKPPKLVAQVRFLAGAPQEGTGSTEAHTLDSAGSIPAPAIRGDPRRAAALIRLSARVRFPPSRPRSPHVRVGFSIHLGVAQSGRAPVPGTGDWRFESSHPDRSSSTNSSGCGSIWSERLFGSRRLEVRILSPRPRGTSELVNASVHKPESAGFDPLVPYQRRERESLDDDFDSGQDGTVTWAL